VRLIDPHGYKEDVPDPQQTKKEKEIPNLDAHGKKLSERYLIPTAPHRDGSQHEDAGHHQQVGHL
jgi:hypothetical protein